MGKNLSLSFTSFGRITTPVLEIAYEFSGDPGGTPVILLHGFPYDVRAFDEVAPLLADQDAFVLAPYLRGFSPTRFLDDTTIRSGQQGALGQDLIDFMDGLNIEKAVVAGQDWGGRAACIAAALEPGRVAGLVSVGGYNMQVLHLPASLPTRNGNEPIGISITFTRSEGVADSTETVTSCASCCGALGRRPGVVLPRHFSRALRACTTPTSSMSSSIPTATVTDSSRANLTTRDSKT